ncbi:MAG TPA: hypothetical protein DDW52_20500 [Planctomycetaceae bacterium]|nr:hypothetical protein [Planctomycetaceae bacterium]
MMVNAIQVAAAAIERNRWRLGRTAWKLRPVLHCGLELEQRSKGGCVNVIRAALRDERMRLGIAKPTGGPSA